MPPVAVIVAVVTNGKPCHQPIITSPGSTKMIAASVPAAEATVWTMLFSRIVESRNARSTAIEITAAGIEGGAVYALSARLREAIAAEGEATALLDLRPDVGAADLARRLDGPRGSLSLSNHLRRAGLRSVLARLHREQDRVEHLRRQGRMLSPQSTLDRGYALVSTTDGEVVRDPEVLDAGQVLRVRVAEGDFAVLTLGAEADDEG